MMFKAQVTAEILLNIFDEFQYPLESGFDLKWYMREKHNIETIVSYHGSIPRYDYFVFESEDHKLAFLLKYS